MGMAENAEPVRDARFNEDAQLARVVARLPSVDGDQTGDDQESEGQHGDLLHETSFTQHSAPHLTSVTALMSVHNSRECSREWEDRAGHTSVHNSRECSREWEDGAGHTSVHNSYSRDLEDQPASKVVKESKTSWDAFGCGSEFFEDKGKTSHAGSRSWASVASCEPQNNTRSPLWATVSGASSRLEPWD